MDAKTVAQYISHAPKGPGVYTWRDSHGKPLYIGKAGNLKSRLSSYPKSLDSRIQLMVSQATLVDWVEVETEIEALIEESQRIKRWRPKFNIDMRDDKQYFFVAVTDEDFPQLILTHQARSNKIKKPIAELIGPFTDGAPLKSTLRTLRGLFPYCSCKQKHHIRCLNAHIGRCLGFCCLKSPATKPQKAEYARNIRAIKDILTGKRDTLITKLEKEMKTAGKSGDLEYAVDLQRKIERIRHVFENAQINAARARTATRHHGALEQVEAEFGLGRVPRRIEGYDIANISGQHATGSMVAFVDGRADNQEYRKFNIRTVAGSNDTAMLAEVLNRRLSHPEWQYPNLILVDGGKGQLNAALKTLDALGVTIPVIALTKNDKHQGDHIFSSLDRQVRSLKDLPSPLANLILHIDNEAHRFAISHYRQRHSRSMVEN